MKVATFRWCERFRSAKHDVVAIAEVVASCGGRQRRERAVTDERILITEDKDFGQLVYASMRRTGGVIFIRFPARARRYLAVAVLDLGENNEENGLSGNFYSGPAGTRQDGPKSKRLKTWILGTKLLQPETRQKISAGLLRVTPRLLKRSPTQADEAAQPRYERAP